MNSESETALEKQKEEIGIAISVLLSAYVRLETQQMLLLADLLDDRGLTFNASIIFYSISQNDIRLKIIERLITLRSKKNELLRAFKFIKKEIKDIVEVRNTVAHGNIVTTYGPGDPIVQIKGPLADFFSRNRHKDAWKDGYSEKQLKEWVGRIRELENKIYEFRTSNFRDS